MRVLGTYYHMNETCNSAKSSRLGKTWIQWLATKLRSVNLATKHLFWKILGIWFIIWKLWPSKPPHRARSFAIPLGLGF